MKLPLFSPFYYFYEMVHLWTPRSGSGGTLIESRLADENEPHKRKLSLPIDVKLTYLKRGSIQPLLVLNHKDTMEQTKMFGPLSISTFQTRK